MIVGNPAESDLWLDAPAEAVRSSGNTRIIFAISEAISERRFVASSRVIRLIRMWSLPMVASEPAPRWVARTGEKRQARSKRTEFLFLRDLPSAVYDRWSFVVVVLNGAGRDTGPTGGRA